MTPRLWQKKPKLNYSGDVLDIVQYGSSIAEENPNDIDIAVIFRKISLDEQLKQAQALKKQLQKLSEQPIHIKSFDFCSFFEESNFSRESILFYGKSLISGGYFSGIFGLSPRIQISYSLKEFKKKDKVKFHYMLKGKKKEYGLLRKYGGNLLNPGLIEIFPEHEKIFLDAIKKLTSRFKARKILFS